MALGRQTSTELFCADLVIQTAAGKPQRLQTKTYSVHSAAIYRCETSYSSSAACQRDETIWEITSYFLWLLFAYVLPSSLFLLSPSFLMSFCSYLFSSFLFFFLLPLFSFQSVPSLLSSPNFLTCSFLSSFLSTFIFSNPCFLPIVSPSILVSFKSLSSSYVFFSSLFLLFLLFPLPSFLLVSFHLCYFYMSHFASCFLLSLHRLLSSISCSLSLPHFSFLDPHLLSSFKSRINLPFLIMNFFVFIYLSGINTWSLLFEITSSTQEFDAASWIRVHLSRPSQHKQVYNSPPVFFSGQHLQEKERHYEKGNLR